jgi:hypothetical protein
MPLFNLPIKNPPQKTDEPFPQRKKKPRKKRTLNSTQILKKNQNTTKDHLPGKNVIRSIPGF